VGAGLWGRLRPWCGHLRSGAGVGRTPVSALLLRVPARGAAGLRGPFWFGLSSSKSMRIGLRTILISAILLAVASKQLPLELPAPRTWGGRRKGAGRPRGPNAGTPHVARPELKARHPLHITLRVARGLPNLRTKTRFRIVKRAIAAGRSRFGFRVVHYSVQSNHLHLVCEAPDKVALRRGLTGLQVRIARALNTLLGRRGQVFPRPYHSRILKTPREVRNVLAYVLNNARRHGKQAGHTYPKTWTDPCSSSQSFTGWSRSQGQDPPLPAITSGVAAAKTWLLNKGWRRHRLLQRHELPGPT